MRPVVILKIRNFSILYNKLHPICENPCTSLKGFSTSPRVTFVVTLGVIFTYPRQGALIRWSI